MPKKVSSNPHRVAIPHSPLRKRYTPKRTIPYSIFAGLADKRTNSATIRRTYSRVTVSGRAKKTLTAGSPHRSQIGRGKSPLYICNTISRHDQRARPATGGSVLTKGKKNVRIPAMTIEKARARLVPDGFTGCDCR